MEFKLVCSQRTAADTAATNLASRSAVALRVSKSCSASLRTFAGPFRDYWYCRHCYWHYRPGWEDWYKAIPRNRGARAVCLVAPYDVVGDALAIFRRRDQVLDGGHADNWVVRQRGLYCRIESVVRRRRTVARDRQRDEGAGRHRRQGNVQARIAWGNALVLIGRCWQRIRAYQDVVKRIVDGITSKPRRALILMSR